MTAAAHVGADDHMGRALELAERGLYTTHPNPRVGCVLTRHGQVIGEGWHQRAGEPHAEIVALRSVGGEARGATAYVTLEPCCHLGRTPPCTEALIAAGIARVVCAASDPNPKVAGKGIARLQAAGIAVSVGESERAARALNVGFFSRFERGRPHIRLKLAMSLDARTAPAPSPTAAADANAWITDDASRADVQIWRARSSAILTGAGTVRIDNPRLDVRLSYGPWVRQPLRVVLDPDLGCAPASRIFKDDNALIFAAVDAAEHTAAGSCNECIEVVRVPRATHGLDLGAVIERLTSLEVNELFVECGPRLAAAFLQARLVDELILYVAPTFLGADAAPLAALRDLTDLASLPPFEFCDHRLIQNDLRLVLAPKRN